MGKLSSKRSLPVTSLRQSEWLRCPAQIFLRSATAIVVRLSWFASSSTESVHKLSEYLHKRLDLNVKAADLKFCFSV